MEENSKGEQRGRRTWGGVQEPLPQGPLLATICGWAFTYFRWAPWTIGSPVVGDVDYYPENAIL